MVLCWILSFNLAKILSVQSHCMQFTQTVNKTWGAIYSSHRFWLAMGKREAQREISEAREQRANYRNDSVPDKKWTLCARIFPLFMDEISTIPKIFTTSLVWRSDFWSISTRFLLARVVFVSMHRNFFWHPILLHSFHIWPKTIQYRTHRMWVLLLIKALGRSNYRSFK